ncbi:MAG: Lrp/AsnC family transcriptional regulator [Candidatus Bathyarchaeia archaeon]|jgi:Lrp/AsnC family leucine-responsive transcriptional regulator
MDESDYKILEILKKNARTGYSDISLEIGLSTPTIRDRIIRMEGDGIIRGYAPILDYAKLGLTLTAFIGVTLNHPSCCREDVVMTLRTMSEIIEAHYTDGDEDMIVKVVCKDTSAFLKLLARITSIEGVGKTRSVISLSTEIFHG